MSRQQERCRLPLLLHRRRPLEQPGGAKDKPIFMNVEQRDLPVHRTRGNASDGEESLRQARTDPRRERALERLADGVAWFAQGRKGAAKVAPPLRSLRSLPEPPKAAVASSPCRWHPVGPAPLPRVAAGTRSLMGAMKPRRPELGSMLGAVSSPVLHCPQRTQRCLLRLGQAPDARDIEALVGPVAAQRAERLATLEVPERDGPVIPATG